MQELLNARSRGLKELQVGDISSLTESEAAKLMEENPKIMIRPLLSDGVKLVIGFKPEEMEKII